MFTYGVQRGLLDIHRFVDASEHEAGKNLRPFSTQGNHRGGRGRRPGGLRPGLSRHNLRGHAAHQQRLQRL